MTPKESRNIISAEGKSVENKGLQAKEDLTYQMKKSDIETWRGSPDYWSKVIETYNAQLKKEPTCKIFFPLADALLKVGRKGEAVATLEDGIAISPKSHSAMTLLAKIKYGDGDVRFAKEVLEKVVSEKPDLSSAVILLCDIYENEGQREKARCIAVKLSYYYPDSEKVRAVVDRFTEHEKTVSDGVAKSLPEESLCVVKIADEPTVENSEYDFVLEEMAAENEMVFAGNVSLGEDYNYGESKRAKTISKLEGMLARIESMKGAR